MEDMSGSSKEWEKSREATDDGLLNMVKPLMSVDEVPILSRNVLWLKFALSR